MKLILYHRDGCCLCDRLDQMIAAPLERVRKTREVILEHRDISSDPNLVQAYGDRIPVLWCNGEVLLEGRPSQAQVDAVMQKLAAS